jgi:hypothetical protein
MDVSWFAEFSHLFADRIPAAFRAETPPSAEIIGDAENLLRNLIGKELDSLSGKVNTIRYIVDDRAIVITNDSSQEQPVPIIDIQQAMDRLWQDRKVVCEPKIVGPHSEFIGAALRMIPGADTSLEPPTVSLGQNILVEIKSHKSTVKAPDGALDAPVLRYVRTEQRELRNRLIDNRKLAHCDLCGHEVPVELLVAAHIKKRQACTDAEKRDLVNIGMLACKFGCDDLYELGYVTVDETGVITTVEPRAEQHGKQTSDAVDRLNGLRCSAFTPANVDYFDWHRKNTFQAKNART